MNVKNKIMGNDSTALYMGIYGLLIQILSFAVINSISNFIKADSVESTTTTLIYLWYLFPILALFPLTIAILQIRQRKAEGRPFKKPMAGLLVNAAWILAVIVFLAIGFGWTQQNEDEIQLDGMKASEIVSVLSNLGYPVGGGKNYDEPGDTSQYPWNIPGCTSAAEFWIPDGTEDGQSIGYVEVYSFVEACKERRDAAAIISSFYPAEPYYVQVGKVYLQVPKILNEQDAAQYMAALQAMEDGKMPEPYIEGTSVDDYKNNQASVIEEARIIASMPGIFTDKTKIGEVEGIPVYKEELELIAARMKSIGKENPYKDAMDRLKEYKHFESLAKQYGISVTHEEISAYIDQQREMIDNATDPVATSFFKDYFAALRMTEDEYLTNYVPIYAKRLYYKSKVNDYIEAHGIEDISSDDIEYTIDDATYLSKIEGK